MYERDEYEYRIGYQYRTGRVYFTESLDEHDVSERLEFWQTRNRFLLLIDPWVEKRRILKWERITLP